MRRFPTCACDCVYSCIRVCVRLNEWALSGAAPRCGSHIWSHLCWGSVGGERMTLMYLNSRQTFLRHLSVWNQDNWAQSSWTGRSGLVSRRQTLWLHGNSWSDSPGSLRQTDTHKHWSLFVSMIETQCFISKGILFFSCQSFPGNDSQNNLSLFSLVPNSRQHKWILSAPRLAILHSSSLIKSRIPKI